MAPSRRSTEDPRVAPGLRAVRDAVVELSGRVGLVEELGAALEERLDELEATVARALHPPTSTARPALPPPRPLLTAPPAEPPVESLAASTERLEMASEAHERRLRGVEAALADVRIRPVAESTGDRAAARAVELLGAQVRTMTARVAELQADLEMVRRMLDVGSGVDPLAFEEVRTQLARLAQGQAQLELAFREDLASLAQEVRRRP